MGRFSVSDQQGDSVLFLENKGTNSPPKTNTAQTYVQSRLMSLNVPPRHNDNNTKTLNVI